MPASHWKCRPWGCYRANLLASLWESLRSGSQSLPHQQWRRHFPTQHLLQALILPDAAAVFKWCLIRGTLTSTTQNKNAKRPSEIPAAPRPDLLPTTSTSSKPQRKKNPAAFFVKSKIAGGGDGKAGSGPPCPYAGTIQEAASGNGLIEFGLPCRPPSPLSSAWPRGKGQAANFGTDFKRVLALAGRFPERGLYSGSFSCLIKSGIHCNAIPGNAWSKFTASTTESDPALQGNAIFCQTYPEKAKFGVLNSHRGKFFK